ncbi:MAG: Rieske (2Fe-2S) protein [Acidimicrobiales bacterium]
MDLETAVRRLENQEQLSGWAEPIQRLLGTPVLPGGVRDALSGRGLGHPLHPALVSGPLGCWVSASLLDAGGERWAAPARALTGLGALMALPTALSGASDWTDTAQAEQRVGLVHGALNLAATALYATSWVARRRHRRTGVALNLTGAALTAAAGWLGGHLAYAMGVGVDTNAFQTGPAEWSPVEGSLPEEGRAASATAGGVRLVVVRSGGRLFALGDRCSHRGGPLSEGEVTDGCITCPWHGSRFALDGGSVRRSPASVGQPTYEVREAGEGKVEVRRVEPRSLRANPV